jgi:hypothetical protein
MLDGMRHFFWMLMGAMAFTGCQGRKESYLAPAMVGRVVDADSGQPVEDAHLTRHLGRPKEYDPWAEKGAQRLKTERMANTDALGRFTVPPEKGRFLLAYPPPVYDLTLVIRCDRYVTLTTNIDLIKIRPFDTNGVLTVVVGDIPLQPDPK